MNECNKLALIRSGDVVVYRNGRGTLSRRTVEGWKTECGQRLLLLDNRSHCRVEQVIERTRPGKSCGAGRIVFEEAS